MSLGALVQQDFLEGVGRGLEFGRNGFPRVEDDSRRGLDIPGADMNRFWQGDEGRWRKTVACELVEEGAREPGGGWRGGNAHAVEDSWSVMAKVKDVFADLEARGDGIGHARGVFEHEMGLVSLGREEHDQGQFGREADLADALDDLVEPGVCGPG